MSDPHLEKEIADLDQRYRDLDARLSQHERRIHAGTVAGRVILWLVGGLGAVIALGIQVADFLDLRPR